MIPNYKRIENIFNDMKIIYSTHYVFKDSLCRKRDIVGKLYYAEKFEVEYRFRTTEFRIKSFPLDMVFGYYYLRKQEGNWEDRVRASIKKFAMR